MQATTTHIDYKKLYEQSQEQITQLQIQNQSLQLQLAELRKTIFGSKSEKFIVSDTSAQQSDLFPDDKLGQIDFVKTTLVKEYQKQQTKLNVKQHPGRNPLPESLRREVTELLPDEEVTGLKVIGKEIKEVLEYQPGELYVKQIIRPEYIKPSEDGLSASRVIAALPKLPLEKSIAGSSLLTGRKTLVQAMDFSPRIHFLQIWGSFERWKIFGKVLIVYTNCMFI